MGCLVLYAGTIVVLYFGAHKRKKEGLVFGRAILSEDEKGAFLKEYLSGSGRYSIHVCVL